MMFPHAMTGLAIVASIWVSVFTTPTAKAESVALYPERDTSLFEGNNHASNGAGLHLFAGRTGEDAETVVRRALLAFDVADAIPAGSEIQSVELILTVTNAPGIPGVDEPPADSPFLLLFTSTSWAEGTSDAGGSGKGVGPSIWDKPSI
jgi:hypothetical protein